MKLYKQIAVTIFIICFCMSAFVGCAGMTAKKVLAQAKQDLTITIQGEGDLNSLTRNNKLMLKDKLGDVKVSWSVDSPYISLQGGIKQPLVGEGNAEVKITAKLEYKGKSATKDFMATVLQYASIAEYDPFFSFNFNNINTDGRPESIYPCLTPCQDGEGNWISTVGRREYSTSVIAVVDTIDGVDIPQGSKAAIVRDGSKKEIATTKDLVPNDKLIAVEADFYQTAGGAEIRFSTRSFYNDLENLTAVWGVGSATLEKGKIFYYDALGERISSDIQLNTWYTIRAELDLKNNKFWLLYKIAGESEYIFVTAESGVQYTKTLDFGKLYISTGEGEMPEGGKYKDNKNPPSYFTNIVANNTLALAR